MSSDFTAKPIGQIFSEELKQRLLNQACTATSSSEEYEQQQRDKERRARSEALMKEIGPRYQHCSLATYKTDTPEREHSLTRIGLYLSQLDKRIKIGSSLVIVGGVGTGKDHLMIAAMRIALDRGYSVKYIDGVEYFARFRDLFGVHGIDGMESKYIDGLVHPSILGISDPVPPLGGQKNNYGEQLFRIVNARYKMRKPTWITLNSHSPEETVNLLGAPVRDRLRDGGFGIHCKGESYRELSD